MFVRIYQGLFFSCLEHDNLSFAISPFKYYHYFVVVGVCYFATRNLIILCLQKL